MRIGLLPFSYFLLILPSIDASTLSDFQPINGFSPQCTQAYNTPLQGCTQADFQSGHGCSPTCITFLEALTKMLNTDCKGTSAFPNTLIGLFFSQQGTSTLCPNVLGSSGGEPGDQASYGSAASPSTSAESQKKSEIVVSWTSAPTIFASSSIFSSSEASSTFSPSPSVSDSTSSTTVIVQTTVAPTNAPINTISSSGASSSTTSSQTSSTLAASNTGKGGGTILDLNSTGAASPTFQSKSHSWALALLGTLVILVWPL